LPRLIIAVSIPQVGEETAYDLAEHFGTLKKLEKAEFEELKAINGVGDIVAHSIVEWFSDKHNRELIKRLQKVLTIQRVAKPTKSLGPMTGKTVVLTGTLSTLSRDEAKTLIRKAGGDVSSSVSKETDFVVAGENPGEKYDAAQKFGVRILTEKEFLKMAR